MEKSTNLLQRKESEKMWKVLKEILKRLNSIEKRIAGLEDAIRDQQISEVSIEISDGNSNDLVEKYGENRNGSLGGTVLNRNIF